MEFSAPSSGGSGLKQADLEGHVLVVEPQEYIPSMVTSFGDKDAIRVTVHDITTQETHEDVLFFGALIGSLKPQVGKRVLGLMGKGVAKPGQAPPWVLTDLSTNEQAVAAATAYITGQVANSIRHVTPLAQGGTDTPDNRVLVPSALDAALGNLAGITK